MKLHFTKMQGLGNDYVYVDCTKDDSILTHSNPAGIAEYVSDRHFGIGSDGLILIAKSQKADAEMIMYNADGSRGEMCGNGIRCVGKYVYDHGIKKEKTLQIDTLAGIKTLSLETGDDDLVHSVTVSMGKAEFDTRKIPVTYPENEMIGEPLEVKGNIYKVSCISMGNPHCVVISDKDIKKADISKIGPAFEKHPVFPKRINTEFVNIIDRTHITMRVWERGSGETLACGTGACAAAVACIRNGFTENDVEVTLLGGKLMISYDEKTNEVTMTGPCEEVYSGDIVIPEMAEDDDVRIYEEG